MANGVSNYRYQHAEQLGRAHLSASTALSTLLHQVAVAQDSSRGVVVTNNLQRLTIGISREFQHGARQLSKDGPGRGGHSVRQLNRSTTSTGQASLGEHIRFILLDDSARFKLVKSVYHRADPL